LPSSNKDHEYTNVRTAKTTGQGRSEIDPPQSSEYLI
jgi:hypothetical protein